MLGLKHKKFNKKMLCQTAYCIRNQLTLKAVHSSVCMMLAPLSMHARAHTQGLLKTSDSVMLTYSIRHESACFALKNLVPASGKMRRQTNIDYWQT
jgi:hypothetical protein